MIKQKRNRPDWFEVPRDWREALPLPGCVINSNTLTVHRTHLPLLSHHSEVNELLKRLSISKKSEGSPPLTLRDYQEEGVEFVNSRQGSLLAFQMRMGKTPTALATCDPSKGQVVVLGPLESRDVWLTWMKRFWPNEEPVYLEGRTPRPDLLKARLIFCHYDILPYHIIRHRISKLILDEVHLLSGRGQQARTDAARIISGFSDNVVALTGTVLWNKISGLWAILGLCNPGAWGTSFEFSSRYSFGEKSVYGWAFTGVKNGDEFTQRLSEVILTKNWGDASFDLPKIHKNLITVPLDAKGRFEMEKLLIEIHKSPQKLPSIALSAKLRSRFSTLKVPAVIDKVKKLDPQPIVVWVWHQVAARHLSKALEKENIPCWIATGEKGDISDRLKEIAKWKASLEGVLIISMKVGQTAIDLSHAKHAIFMELDHTPSVISQAEMRIFDVSRDMSIDYVVSNHQFDKQLGQILIEKDCLAKQIGIQSLEQETMETLKECFK